MTRLRTRKQTKAAKQDYWKRGSPPKKNKKPRFQLINTSQNEPNLTN